MSKKVLISLLAMFAVSGCATIMEGSDQNINVQTLGCDDAIVTCMVTNDDQRQQATGHRQRSKKQKPLTVQCENKDRSVTGRIMVDSGYETMNAGQTCYWVVLLVSALMLPRVQCGSTRSSVVVPLQCDEEESD